MDLTASKDTELSIVEKEVLRSKYRTHLISDDKRLDSHAAELAVKYARLRAKRDEEASMPEPDEKYIARVDEKLKQLADVYIAVTYQKDAVTSEVVKK